MLQIERVIVVGGGYAGVLAANRLAGRVPEGVEIRLVSPGPRLVHRVRLHEAAARGTDVSIPLSSLLSARVLHDDAKLVGLDAGASCLSVERDGVRERLDYAHAVLALGSAPLSGTSRAEWDAVSSPEAAARFHTRLRALEAGATVVVVGGGLTAIELATEIAEARPDLSTTLVATRLLPYAGEKARRALDEALAALAITVIEGARAEVCDDGVVVEGRVIPADLCALCDGFHAAPIARSLALPAANDGRVRVDSTLRVSGYPNLFAVGDVAAPEPSSIGTGLGSTRMGCVTAMPMGAHAADEIARVYERAEPRGFRFAYGGQCISLGRRRALVLFTDADDRPTGSFLGRTVAAMVKELICRYVIGMIRLESRWSGLYAWPRGRRPLALAEPSSPTSPPRLLG